MKRICLTFISAVFIITGCASDVPQKTSLKLYVLNGGRLNFDTLAPFFGIADDETAVRDMIVPSYLIVHEKGMLLWEGGLPSTLADSAGWQEMSGGWRMRLDTTISEQLKPLDISLDDIDYMAFSHFHFDHVGIANEVKNARPILRNIQYETAFADSVTVPGFSPELYNALDRPEKIIIEGEYDVFGDGRVRLMPTPGHTPGHQVLFLNLEETGPLLLSGDLFVLRVGREKGRTLTCDMDTTTSRQSMTQIEALLETTGASLWIGHDYEHYQQLKKPPLFYQ